MVSTVRKGLKSGVSFVLVFIMLISSFCIIPSSSANVSVNAAGGFITTKLTTVATTVLSRQAMKLLGKAADSTDSKILDLVYKYKAGPTSMRLKQIAETSQQILETVTLIEQDLKDLSKTVSEGFGEVKSLIYNQNVTNEYTRITDISSKYQSLWEDYCKYAEAASKLGDNPTDEQLHELDILLVQMQKEYKRLDMVSLVDALSEVLSDQPSLTGDTDQKVEHNADDATYVKAVKDRCKGTVPFEHQTLVATKEAANKSIEPLINLLALYREFTYYNYDVVMDNEDSTKAQKTAAEADLKTFEQRYTKAMNAINNNCDQTGTDSLMEYEDLNTTMIGVSTSGGVDPYHNEIPAYRVVNNDNGYMSFIQNGSEKIKNYIYAGKVDNYVFIDPHNYYYSEAFNSLLKSRDGKYKMPSSMSDANKFFAKIYKEQGKENPFYYIAELGGIGNVADENGNVTNEFVKGDYFPFDNIKSDEDILSKDITRKSKAIDTSKYSATTNDDKQLKEINTKDIYKDNSAETFTVLWVANSNENSKTILKPTLIGNLSGPNAKATLTDSSGKTLGSSVSPKTLVNIKINPKNGYRLTQLYYVRENGVKTVLADESDLPKNYQDSYEYSFYMPYESTRIYAKYSNAYSITSSVDGKGSVKCNDSAEVGSVVSVDADIPYGYSKDSLCAYGTVTQNEIEIKDNSFVMPDEPVYIYLKTSTGIKDGEGTQDEPYVISKRSELEYVSLQTSDKYMSASYILANDIDMSGSDYLPIGSNEAPFTGTFDGKGYFIRNLSCNKASAGLFGTNKGTIKNLMLENFSFKLAYQYCGAVAAVNDGVIGNCGVIEPIAANIENEGAIAGAGNGTIEGCYAYCVKAEPSFKEICGGTQMKVTDCYSNGESETKASRITAEKMVCSAFAATMNQTLTAKKYDYHWKSTKSVVNGLPVLDNNSELMNMYGFWGYEGEFGTISCNPEMAAQGTSVEFTLTPATVQNGSEYDAEIESIKAFDDNGNEVTIKNNSLTMPDSNVTFKVEYHFNETFSGDGTKEKPYIISTIKQFEDLATNLYNFNDKYKDAYYELGSDLDFNGAEITPLGDETHKFNGKFNGRGHVISNFTITDKAYAGVFGVADVDAEIYDLGVENAAIKSKSDAVMGGIVGWNSGMIYKCYFTGEVTQTGTTQVYESKVGGIAGLNLGLIFSCYNRGSISGPVGNMLYCVGGIAGSNSLFEKNMIFDCYNEGVVKETENLDRFITAGAICGASAPVLNCWYDKDLCEYAYTNSNGQRCVGDACTASEMKTDVADKLGNDFRTSPSDEVNDGFPVLKSVGVGRTLKVTFAVEGNKTAVKSFVSDVLYQESIKKSSSLSNSLNIVSKLSHAVRIDDNTFEVFYGKDFKFTVNPAKYNNISKLTVNGKQLAADKKTGEYTLENVKEDQMITVSLTGGEYKDKNKDEKSDSKSTEVPGTGENRILFVTVLSAILIGAFVFITVIVFITVMRRKKTN